MKIFRISVVLLLLASMFSCKGNVQNNEQKTPQPKVKAKVKEIKIGSYSLTANDLKKALSTQGFSKVFPKETTPQAKIEVTAEDGASFEFLEGATQNITLTTTPQTVKIKASKDNFEDATYTLILSKEEDVPYQPSSYEEMIDVLPPESGIVGTTPTQANLVGDGVFFQGRTVKLSPYQIAKYELTYKVWHEVVEWAKAKGYKFSQKAKEGIKGATEGAAPTTDSHPVTTINWYDAVVWCNAYTERRMGAEQCVYKENTKDGAILKDATQDGLDSKVFWDKTKKGFRLATEAEWEYAARYQKDNSNNWAIEYGSGVWLTKTNAVSGACKAWDDGNSIEETYKYCWWFYNPLMPQAVCHPVASKLANHLGIHDMSGNLQEWVYDWYKASEEKTETVSDPAGPSFQVGTTSEKILKGGSYKSLTLNLCLPASRSEKRTPKSAPEADCGIRLACYKS